MQFSLAALLAVIAVLSIPLAWVGYMLQSSRQEQAGRSWTQKELAAIGGQASGWSIESGASHLRFFGTAFDQPALERLKRIVARNPYITDLSMEATTGTDRALQSLRRKLSHLEEVQFRRADLPGNLIAGLGTAPDLKRVAVDGKIVKWLDRNW